ncbi:hypothetical protein D3C85_470490 [compost metagenome]
MPPTRLRTSRVSRPHAAHTSSAPPSTRPSARRSEAAFSWKDAASTSGSDAFIARSMCTASTVATRSTAVMPFSVAKADTPMSTSTTSALRLPPPRRTSVLLPQPEDSTMPTPNSRPPTSAASQRIWCEA